MQKRIIIFLFSIILFSQIPAFSLDNNPNLPKYLDYSKEFVGQDSWEGFNRKVFVFNMRFNKYIVRPINICWASIVPRCGMERIKSFYNNINYPKRVISCLLERDFQAAHVETVRFLTNSTIGILGFYDPAYTKYGLEPKDEDMQQVLASYNIKLRHYLVLPLILQGNERDILGQILNLPLSPPSYIVGPVALTSTGISVLNETTFMQPLFKMSESYADPYEVSKQLYGIDKYIKNNNFDRSEVFNKLTQNDNIKPVTNYLPQDSSFKPDVTLNNYDSQGALVDTMRCMLFDYQNLDKSKWSELSIWNKSFPKKIKTDSINVSQNRDRYKYRYILQKNKTAPVAIIYPSIGEDIMSQESLIQAKLLYDQGYSVIIMGSAFQWAFVKSMPENYAPGLPEEDAKYLRKVTLLILDRLQVKHSCVFDKKILVGTSFGALTGLFTAAQEDKNNTLNISKYIFICPPINEFFALKQIDKYSQDWRENPYDVKFQMAVTSKKVIDLSQKIATNEQKAQTLPFTKYQSELAMGYTMKQKLSDIVFSIENCSRSKKNDLHDYITNMSFSDYADTYIISKQKKPLEQLTYESSLYSITDFLENNSNYKIYHSLDDCFANEEQLKWLKKETGDKSTLFSDGSHLGFLYRPEFISSFIKEINGNPNKL